MAWLKALIVALLIFVSAALFAQDVAPPAEPGDWDTFLTAIGGTRGAGVMGVIALAIQGLLLLLRSPLGYLAGPYKLLLITALTLFLGVTGLKIEGFDWQSAIMHSSTLASFQVFLHQMGKQLLEAKRRPKLE